MSIKKETRNPSEIPERNSSAETVLGFVIFGFVAAGAVGVYKASNMTSGLDVMFCLLGSVAAFGAVYYIYFGKH